MSAATTQVQRGGLVRSPLVSWALRVATAAALAIDAGVHAVNASGYDDAQVALSQDHLFRIEAGVACAGTA